MWAPGPAPRDAGPGLARDPRNDISNRCCSCCSRTTLWELLTWKNDSSPLVLPVLQVIGSEWGSCAPQGTSGHTWKYIWLSQPDGGAGCYLQLVGRDQGCRQISYSTQNSHTILFRPKMSIVPWLRNPPVVLPGWCVWDGTICLPPGAFISSTCLAHIQHGRVASPAWFLAMEYLHLTPSPFWALSWLLSPWRLISPVWRANNN